MTNTKSTKRALLSSVLALFLCFSMLLGTTFAWFTDSVTSANNVIQSGNLDIELEYFNGTEWVDVKDKSDILTNTLWEPGVTEVAYLRVANAGSLALTYQLGINILNEKNGINAAGESFKLSDYIMFGVVENVNGETGAYATREAAVAALASSQKISAGYTKAASMIAGDELYLALVVYMPTEVGNVANHNGTDAGKPQIDLGINIMATQYNYEEDSFDANYDAGLVTEENGLFRTLSDGSEIFYYNEESGYAGRVRLLELPASVGSEYVVPTEVNDLGGALVGVTLDKLTLPAGIDNAYKSLEGATIKEVVIEEGTTTIPNRMFYKTNVETVVIPSTVTTIVENAFAMSAPETLIIPASVTHIGEAAFQHMPNLEKVIIEGNVDIEGYAFRGCAALRTVELKGDDVNFVVSATGKNSAWFCNGESNNPNTSNITFYVENDTVAARLRTALAAEKPETTPIWVDGKLTVKAETAEKLVDKLANATPGMVIDATGVSVQMNQIANTAGSRPTVTLGAGTTIKGATITTNGANDAFLTDGATIGGEIVFEGCSFVSSDFSRKTYFQSGQNAGNTKLVFNDCIFYGQVIVADNNGGGVEFNNCKFELKDGSGYVQCMGGNVDFNGCTFNIGGSSTMFSTNMTKYGKLNLYSERYNTTVTLNGCNAVSVHKHNALGGVGTVVTN